MYHELSFWERESFLSGFDIAIVGSGIVGMSAALYLKSFAPNLKILLIERGSLPYGASTRNAGFACFGCISEILSDLKSHTESEVWELVRKRYEGLQALRKWVGDEAMQYEGLGNYEVFSSEEKDLQIACETQMPTFNRILSSILNLPNCYQILPKKTVTAFGFEGVTGMIHNVAEGQLHTGKLMLQLQKLCTEQGVRFLTGVEITKIEESEKEISLICSNSWRIACSKVIVATNGFAAQLLPNLEVIPGRNQVWITEPLSHLPFQGAFHYQQGYYYFRNVENRILIGGGRHLSPATEKTYEFGQTDLIQNGLHRLLTEMILPNQPVKIEMKWSGILGLGNEKKPIVKALSSRLFVGVRMGGMGVAIGNLIGKEVATLTLSH